jgi:hypothetical protein
LEVTVADGVCATVLGLRTIESAVTGQTVAVELSQLSLKMGQQC